MANLNFYDFFELSTLKAINSALDPTLESIWRMRCRSYSQQFHTPLHEVYNLDPMDVLLALAEERYTPSVAADEPEELLDILCKMKDPNYRKISQEETEDLVDAVLNKEIARANKRKAPTQEIIKAAVREDEARPKSGGMDFGSLEAMEAKAENNKEGF